MVKVTGKGIEEIFCPTCEQGELPLPPPQSPRITGMVQEATE